MTRGNDMIIERRIDGRPLTTDRLAWGAQRGKTCAVEECDRPARDRGYCSKHYQRLRATGDPRGTKIAGRGEINAWLAAHAEWPDKDACLAWPFGHSDQGYASAGGGKLGHVMMCALAHGEKPAEKPDVAHSCDNPGCVNPHHLRWATHQENMDDMVRRSRVKHGAEHFWAKLDEAAVRIIRSTEPGPGVTQALADRFGVAPATIWHAQKNRTWKRVA